MPDLAAGITHLGTEPDDNGFRQPLCGASSVNRWTHIVDVRADANCFECLTSSTNRQVQRRFMQASGLPV